MRRKAFLFVAMVVLSASCGGSEKSVAEPALNSMAEPVRAEGHLAIVPFVITTTATKPDGAILGLIMLPGSAESTVESISAHEPDEVPESTVAP